MNKQAGFSAVESLLILVIVGIVSFTDWYVWHAKNNANKSYSSATTAGISNGMAKLSSGAKPLNGQTAGSKPASSSTSASSRPQTQPNTSSGELKYTAKIISDACVESAGPAAVGDTGCSMTIGDYSIQVVHGNTNTPHLGTVTGLNLNIDQTGSTADVYALKTEANTASIWSDAKYYVHIH